MPDLVTASITVTVLAVIALVAAEQMASQRAVGVAKSLASLGFVAVACASGATGSRYGVTVLVALVACALGDVLLIRKGAGPLFLSGMGAFALGHAAFAAAFWQRGSAPGALVIALSLMAALALATLRWLGPRLPPELRVPIRAYMAIISAMVALAAGASVASGDPRLLIGAVAFATSDLSVARERFVQPAFVNVLWGLPLYYAAQLLLALTVP